MTAGPRTVLFVVTSFWAYGELAIATEFAGRMAGSGFRPLFLVPPTHRGQVEAAGLDHRVLIPGSGKINRIQLQDIAHVHRPALVVLADFLNFDFCDRHYGLGRADLAVFDCPIGTFDDFSWGRPGAWMDTYGFRAKYEGEMTVEGLSFRLRPCPLNNPLDPDAADIRPYPLLGSTADVEVSERAAVRRGLGLAKDRPLVLLTGAAWQRTPAAFPLAVPFADACRTMLERLLTTLLEHADVLCVGARPAFRDRAPDGFHVLDPLEPDRFARLLQAVDLHLSNNICSVSLHRLALRGIPSVAVANSLHKSAGRVSWKLPEAPPLTDFARRVVDGADYLYPCLMFPVGWHAFLGPLLAGNPFSDLVPRVEVFAEQQALATIVPLLGPGPERDGLADARETYLEVLRKLPEVETILHEVAA